MPPKQQEISILRPGAHSLPDDLAYDGIVQCRGKEMLRIRFSLKYPDRTVDLPLSLEALAGLLQEVGFLNGVLDEELPEEVERLLKNLQPLRP